MKILSIEAEPIATLPYVNAVSGGGSAYTYLPILQGKVDALPQGLTALFLASDLQGVAPSAQAGGALLLLGQALVEYMETLSGMGELPPLSQIGALLCGDLYAAPGGDVRGATGDVRPVWQSFAANFRFTAGVAGNHDLFAPHREVARATSRPGDERFDRHIAQDAARRFAAQAGVHLLDGDTVELCGLRIGGVSGIIGNTSKPNRRDSRSFCALFEKVLDAAPDVVLLHEGPDDPKTQGRGNPDLRELMDAARDDLLVLCGHRHWSSPLATLESGNQILNVDARAVLLTS
jgi:hypothetical protein